MQHKQPFPTFFVENETNENEVKLELRATI